MKNNKLIIWTFVYVILYLKAFFRLESRRVPLHIIHCWLDDKIPFCQYFIIPYVLWFFYLGATGIYFLFVCKEKKESERFILNACAGNIIFLIVSLLYPNGHMLRPVIHGDGFFIEIVKLLYRIDTATNIFPSMHTYVTMACAIALLRQEMCKKRIWMQIGIHILSVSIICSTMALKQHSVLDVVTALALNLIFCSVFYGAEKEKEKVKKEKRYAV